MHSEIAGQIVLIRCNKINSSENKTFSCDEGLTKLSESIRKNGILQPLTVRPLNYGMYEIICGERRFSASKLAGITSVPCIVMDIDEKTAAAYRFMENSFKNSYSVFDESDIIKALILNFEYTIDEIASMLSCDVAEIIDKLKILHFSRENMIKAEKANLTFNQCKTLLKLENTEFFDNALQEVTEEKLNDFQTEEYVDKILRNLHNTAVFKDIRIFTNTISNAVEKMKNAGVNVFYNKQEDEEKITFSIVISKNIQSAVKSQ